MKIAATGHNGKIGQRLLKMGVIPLDCDVTDLAAVRTAIQEVKPDVIVHLASQSDVDFCELPENKERVIKVNLRGTFHVASAAQEAKCGVALVSSDHVFDGKKGPYKETDLPKNPVNFYGMSKMAAESLTGVFPNLKIVRTSHLFNYDRILTSFLDDELGDKIDAPIFLRRSFMFEGHFAEGLFYYLNHFLEMPKVLHISGSETITWYEYALAVASVFGIDKNCILPRRKEWMKGLAAPRPRKTGLNTTLSSKFLRPYSYIEGLMAVKAEQE